MMYGRVRNGCAVGRIGVRLSGVGYGAKGSVLRCEKRWMTSMFKKGTVKSDGTLEGKRFPASVVNKLKNLVFYDPKEDEVNTYRIDKEKILEAMEKGDEEERERLREFRKDYQYESYEDYLQTLKNFNFEEYFLSIQPDITIPPEMKGPMYEFEYYQYPPYFGLERRRNWVETHTECKIHVQVAEFKFTPAQMERFEKIVGPRYDKINDKLTIISRDMDSVNKNCEECKNIIIRLLEEVRKVQ